MVVVRKMQNKNLERHKFKIECNVSLQMKCRVYDIVLLLAFLSKEAIDQKTRNEKIKQESLRLCRVESKRAWIKFSYQSSTFSRFLIPC